MFMPCGRILWLMVFSKPIVSLSINIGVIVAIILSKALLSSHIIKKGKAARASPCIPKLHPLFTLTRAMAATTHLHRMFPKDYLNVVKCLKVKNSFCMAPLVRNARSTTQAGLTAMLQFLQLNGVLPDVASHSEMRPRFVRYFK